VALAGPDLAVVEDKVQEIRFYISQGFWDMAQAAIQDLAELDPQNSELDSLRTAVSSGQSEAAAKAAAASRTAPPEIQVEPTTIKEVPAEPAAQISSAPAVSPKAAPEVRVEPPAIKPVPVETPSTPAPPVEEFVLDLEEVSAEPAVEEDILGVEPVKTPAKPAATPEPVATPAAARAPEPTADVLGDLVSDLEASLGDFVPAEQHPASPAASAATAAAASAASLSQAAPAHAASAAANGGMRDAESTSVLSDILSELQEDLGEEAVEAEDPETHYNLGIAFKEMGLLDEAIGELQKVCHAVEHGNSFSQPVQAYTWLAQCLVDKGVPEAAVRWYEKALTLPGLDHTSRCAICYDLGSAYEAFGDKKSALANFMEVYSSNIDFRDVATRIKVLKS
jgi:tetratricopeptide (TPR) repeat protein